MIVCIKAMLKMAGPMGQVTIKICTSRILASGKMIKGVELGLNSGKIRGRNIRGCLWIISIMAEVS